MVPSRSVLLARCNYAAAAWIDHHAVHGEVMAVWTRWFGVPYVLEFFLSGDYQELHRPYLVQREHGVFCSDCHVICLAYSIVCLAMHIYMRESVCLLTAVRVP